jgi:hypothetical protein
LVVVAYNVACKGRIVGSLAKAYMCIYVMIAYQGRISEVFSKICYV